MSKVLIVVDMQNDFIDGALGTPEAQAIVPAVAAKIKEYKENGDLVVYTMDTHEGDYLETQEGKNLPVPHCMHGTEGWKIKEGLIEEHDVFVLKNTFGSWELPMVVNKLTKAVDPESIEVIGLCTDICVISNVMVLKAWYEEVPFIVDSACCAGVTPESHQNALNAMKMCQIKII